MKTRTDSERALTRVRRILTKNPDRGITSSEFRAALNRRKSLGQVSAGRADSLRRRLSDLAETGALVDTGVRRGGAKIFVLA
jgi:hypothetical protein